MIGYAIPRPRLGVMLEVPSMVFMLPQLASRIDFISVGTNDLTQYLLAVDRNNTRVASMYDSHPAVLRALAMIAHDAERFGIDLRLCGRDGGRPDVRDDPYRPRLPPSVDERPLGGEGEISAAPHRC